MTDPRLLIRASEALLDGWTPTALFIAEGDTPKNAIEVVYLGAGEHGGDLVYAMGSVRELRRGCLYLDLSRAEVRDRVARVVADHAGHGADVASACVVPGSRLGAPYPHYGLSSVHPERGERWTAFGEHVHLDDLAPNDPTLLPDGSRLVDALALAAVARQVLGLEPVEVPHG